jgi:hypothetical protein
LNEQIQSERVLVRPEELLKVQKHFNIFYLNRLQFLGRVLEDQKILKAEKSEFQFKPHLNQNSSAIAAKYRQKIADTKVQPSESTDS